MTDLERQVASQPARLSGYPRAPRRVRRCGSPRALPRDGAARSVAQKRLTLLPDIERGAQLIMGDQLTALAASVTEPALFRSSREFALLLGLVQPQNSSGGKARLGRSLKKELAT